MHRALLLTLCAACAADPAITGDAAIPVDAATFGDAASTVDAATDAGAQVPGFGAIVGPCGVLAAALTSSAPQTFSNHIDFAADPYDDADYARLTPGGREIVDDGNAGGSSLFSEVFAFELLHRCDDATLLKTETEIAYSPPQGRITDLLVEVRGQKLGVSVTRAVAFPFDAPYPPERARTLMEDKLGGIVESTGHVDPVDAWSRQILYILAYDSPHVAVLEAALAGIDPQLRGDTIVMITVSDGDDAFLY